MSHSLNSSSIADFGGVTSSPVSADRQNEDTHHRGLSFRWTINDFSHHQTRGEQIYSREYSIDTADKVKFKLALCPRFDYNGQECVLIGPRYDTPTRAKCTFAIIDITGRELEKVSVMHETLTGAWYVLVRRDALWDRNRGLLRNDQLTVHCQIDVHEDANRSETLRLRDLSHDLKSLLQSEDLSDVTIHVNGRDFRAHKAILAARSPVFRKMFTNGMKESHLNHVEIPDLEPRVFEHMLLFLYGAESCLMSQLHSKPKDVETEQLAIELLKAADKYQIEGLKLICERGIYEHLLTVESVARVLSSADLYNATELKARAIKFVVSHVKEVVTTDTWRLMAEQRPWLVAEVEHIYFMVAITSVHPG